MAYFSDAATLQNFLVNSPIASAFEFDDVGIGAQW